MNPPPSADLPGSLPCRCGHDRELHDHDRPGSDCGVGGPEHCAAFHHATPLPRRLLARLGRHRPVDHGDGPLAPVHPLAAARAARARRPSAPSRPATGSAEATDPVQRTSP